MVLIAFAMSIPIGTDYLNKAHASLHHAPREKTNSAKFFSSLLVHSVQFSSAVAFTGDVNEFRRRCLHPERQLVICDLRVQPRVVLSSLPVLIVPIRHLLQ